MAYGWFGLRTSSVSSRRWPCHVDEEHKYLRQGPHHSWTEHPQPLSLLNIDLHPQKYVYQRSAIPGLRLRGHGPRRA
jgi:hypothetical protein